jgi:predicted small secreted protein
MKHFSLKTLSLIFVFVLAASVFSACGVDPNVKQ